MKVIIRSFARKFVMVVVKAFVKTSFIIEAVVFVNVTVKAFVRKKFTKTDVVFTGVNATVVNVIKEFIRFMVGIVVIITTTIITIIITEEGIAIII